MGKSIRAYEPKGERSLIMRDMILTRKGEPHILKEYKRSRNPKNTWENDIDNNDD